MTLGDELKLELKHKGQLSASDRPCILENVVKLGHEYKSNHGYLTTTRIVLNRTGLGCPAAPLAISIT